MNTSTILAHSGTTFDFDGLIASLGLGSRASALAPSISLARFTELLNRDGWKHTYAYTVGDCAEAGGDLPDGFRIEDCREGFDYPISLEVLSELDGVSISWLTSASYVAGALGGLIESPDHHVTFEPLTIRGVSVFNTTKRILDVSSSCDCRALLRVMPEAFRKFDHSARVPAVSLTALEAK